MKKGKFSFIVAVVLASLGALSVVLGILNGMGLFEGGFASFLSAVGAEVSVSAGPYALLEAGIFLLSEAALIVAFRLRKPFSMSVTVLLLFAYMALTGAYRVYNAIELPSLFPERLVLANPGLLYTLFILEVLLILVLLAIFSPLDVRWRKKRELQLRALEREGVIKSKETLEEEKLVKRQRILNDKAEKEKARDEKKYAKDLEKREEAEKKKLEREKKRDQKEYEKKREKEEIRRSKEREKEERRIAKEKDRLREKEEIEQERLENERLKEEKKLQKAIRDREEEEKKNTLPDIGPAPEYDNGIGNPDTPLSFPSFEEMPEFKTIGHHTYPEEKALPEEEKKSVLIESPGFMDNLRSEIDDEWKRSEEEENSKDETVINTKHFTGGGMLEAALENYNSTPENTERPKNLRPIIGLYDDEADENKINPSPSLGSSSFAPSGLDPNHPRYKMFKNLQGGVRDDSIPREDKNEAGEHVAPSGLDPSHPRYKMFESIQNGKVEESPIKKEESHREESIAPSYIGKDHPRYKLFEALSNNSSSSSVSYTPGRAFEAEDESEVHSEYSPSSTFTEEKEDRDDERYTPSPASADDNSVSPLFYDKKDEVSAPIFPSEEKKETPSPQPQFVPPEMPRVRNVEVDDDGRRTFETKSDDEMEDDFNMMVGVGDLASNRGGLTAIALRQQTVYTPPEVMLLKDYPKVSQEIDYQTQEQGEIIVRTLAEQKISVELSNIIKGPAVTMYELRLAQGMIISRIKAREDEINYALGGKKVRILAPVPGKQAVGIEVPNASVSIIGFKDMVFALRDNPKYMSFNVPMILGRTVTGEPIVIDVAKMPHMIIAGTTGSGKSVCINAFINTILYQKSPKDVRLMLVDPKVVELTIYNGIPHLLTPVITDAKRAIKALDWLVSEMERRYAMLAHYGVRNVVGLNEKIASGELKSVEKVPYIVLIMDEFADIMAVVGKEMDAAISRIAAKARAAGIHLILATQRPSSDVILGTLKSNLPGRIAFAVSSGTNSRVILDEMGAENLLGKGDMLLLDPSAMGLKRIQGAFVSDGEVEKITSFVQNHNSRPEFLEESVFEEEGGDDDDEGEEFYDDEGDEDLYEMAKKIVYERKSASASYLQRRLKIGYNRAARIVEQMEEDGIVGPANGSKPREILKYE